MPNVTYKLFILSVVMLSVFVLSVVILGVAVPRVFVRVGHFPPSLRFVEMAKKKFCNIGP